MGVDARSHRLERNQQLLEKETRAEPLARGNRNFSKFCLEIQEWVGSNPSAVQVDTKHPEVVERKIEGPKIRSQVAKRKVNTPVQASVIRPGSTSAKIPLRSPTKTSRKTLVKVENSTTDRLKADVTKAKRVIDNLGKDHQKAFTLSSDDRGEIKTENPKNGIQSSRWASTSLKEPKSPIADPKMVKDPKLEPKLVGKSEAKPTETGLEKLCQKACPPPNLDKGDIKFGKSVGELWSSRWASGTPEENRRCFIRDTPDPLIRQRREQAYKDYAVYGTEKKQVGKQNETCVKIPSSIVNLVKRKPEN